MSVWSGKDGFIWFQGVVEDRADPEELGRMRVRCLGFHTEDRQILPTSDLPWAYPVGPITSASMNGIGVSPIGVVEGSWVFGFFRDGESCQEPVIIGTFGGVPLEKPNSQEGFSDPSGSYPIDAFVGEPDTNRLARGVEEETIIERKKNNIDKMEVAGSIGESQEIEEPETPFAPIYPYNHVKQTESGHFEEFDDTPGVERMHRYHRSGSFEEIHPDGSKVTKIVGDQYEVVLKDNNLHVKGNMNITVDGNSSILTKGDCVLEVEGNMEHVVTGDLTMNAGGEVKITAGENVIVRGDAIRLN